MFYKCSDFEKSQVSGLRNQVTFTIGMGDLQVWPQLWKYQVNWEKIRQCTARILPRRLAVVLNYRHVRRITSWRCHQFH